jgi:molecular chaperone GrpE
MNKHSNHSAQHEPNEEETGKSEAAKEAKEIKPSDEVTISDDELRKLKQEAGDYKHKYLHLLADAENARKRLQKDRDEMTQYTIRGIISDFLNPIDHLENALKYTENASDEVKHWATGFKMILNQFKDVLANNGVKPFTALGKEFDPHLHDAVEMVESDEYPPGIVIEESTRGYAIGGKTLRPARVKVSKAITSKDNELATGSDES